MKRVGRLLALGTLLTLGAASVATSRARAEPVATSPAHGKALDTLLANLAKSPGLFAKFHEERSIALLVAPLKSDGTLHFARKHGLARHTLSPSKQSVLLADDTLSFWDGKRTETVQLRSAPGLRAFADGFRMILGADRKGLEKNFRLRLEGAPEAAWTLQLAPIDAQLAKMVRGIEVTGQGIVLQKLVVRETNGDTTTTTFHDVDTAKTYTPDEAARVFRLPTSSTP
jgi:outer membrane lipoprotein-sorting protein